MVVFRPGSYDSERQIVELFGETEYSEVRPRRICALERAHQGSLFIDEITYLSEKAQTLLLKFLQTNQLVKPDGKKIELDVRIISSTRFEEKEISNFNKELFYRLNVINIKMPRLSEHKEDIPLLCETFIKQISETMSLPYKKISEEAIASLQLMEWEGNVRQLRNVVEQIYINSHIKDDRIINKEHIVLRSEEGATDSLNAFGIHESIMSLPLREAREVFERQYLTSQMQRFSGNISRTSNFVGMERSALHRKLKSLNIISAHNDEKAAAKEEETVD
jgi:two-component system nitrogen regulation response regulator NtrX